MVILSSRSDSKLSFSRNDAISFVTNRSGSECLLSGSISRRSSLWSTRTIMLSGLPNQSSAPLSTKFLHFAILCRSLLFCSCATDMVRNSWSRMSSSGKVGRHREASFKSSQNSFTMFSNLEKLLDNISIDDMCACCSTSICASRYRKAKK